MPKAKKIPPYKTLGRFGILNHVGTIWTPETFESEAQATNYIKAQQAANPTWSLGQHKVIPVRVTVSAIAERGGERT